MMKRVLARLWDFPSAAILTLILLTVSLRLYATDWAPGLETALFLTILLGAIVARRITRGLRRCPSAGRASRKSI